MQRTWWKDYKRIVMNSKGILYIHTYIYIYIYPTCEHVTISSCETTPNLRPSTGTGLPKQSITATALRPRVFKGWQPEAQAHGSKQKTVWMSLPKSSQIWIKMIKWKIMTFVTFCYMLEKASARGWWRTQFWPHRMMIGLGALVKASQLSNCNRLRV